MNTCIPFIIIIAKVLLMACLHTCISTSLRRLMGSLKVGVGSSGESDLGVVNVVVSGGRLENLLKGREEEESLDFSSCKLAIATTCGMSVG